MKLNIKTVLSVSFIFAPFIFLNASCPAHAELQNVTVGTGSAKFNSNIQVWANNDTTNAVNGANFRLRRAEFKFSGTVIPDVRWAVMIDPAKTLKTGGIAASNDNKVLQDLFLGFTVAPDLELMFGQFKQQTTTEGLDSAGELIFPERAYVARVYGERRDLGALVTYGFKQFKFSGSITNGQGPNIDDINSKKDLNFRAEYNPLNALSIAAFTTAADYSYEKHAHWGGSARYSADQLILRAELAHGNDLLVSSNGWVMDLGYSISDHWQPVLRHEGFSTNAFSATVNTFGVNYYLNQHHSKIQFAYELLENMIGNTGTYIPSLSGHGSQMTLVFAASI